MTSFQRVIKYCAIGFAIFLAITIIYGISSAGLALVSAITGSPFSKGKDESYLIEEDDTKFSSLDIHLSAGKLSVKTSDTFRVEAKNVSKNFKVEVTENGILQIDDSKATRFLWFNIGNSNAKIDLYLPKDFVASNADIDTGAGEIEIEALHADNLVISTGAGRLKGYNIIASETAKIENGAGEVILRDVNLKDAIFECGIGRVSVTGQIVGNNTVDCGIGEVVLELKGSIADYNIDIDKGIGSARINGEKYSGFFNNNASNSLDIEGGIGSIVIDFKE